MYEYGYCEGRAARRDKDTGVVEMYNRPAGAIGSMEAFWWPTPDVVWSRFVPW